MGKSNEAAVADQKLALQDVVGLLVSPGHQVGVARLLPSINPSWEASGTAWTMLSGSH
jgi:hypothetical protein